VYQLRPAPRPRWQQATALVSLGAGGVVTGLSFVPGSPADLTSPATLPLALMALEKSAQPAPSDDALLRSAIVHVAQHFLRMAERKSPAEMEAIIWRHASVDGANHGPSCAVFASLTLELGSHVAGHQSWVTGGTSYPWPLHEWADARVDPNPDSLGIISVLQDAQRHDRWRPLGDGYDPRPGDWVLFDGHVEVVTDYTQGVLHTVGGDSLPDYSVNAHSYAGPLSGQGVAGFVDNGLLLAPSAAAPAQGSAPADGGQAPRARAAHSAAKAQARPAARRAARPGRQPAAAGPAPQEVLAPRVIPVPPAGPMRQLAQSRALARPGDWPGLAGAPAPGSSAAPAASPAPDASPRARAQSPARVVPQPPPARHRPRGHELEPRANPAPRVIEGRESGRADVPGISLRPPMAAPRSRDGQARIPGVLKRAHHHRVAPPGELAPYQRHHHPAPAQPQVPATPDQQAFINAVAPGAMDSQRKYGVPASVTIAQAIDESGWGQSLLATKDHNLFGIKGTGPAGSDLLPTQEFTGGRLVATSAPFRIYHNVGQSIEAHGKLLANSEYFTNAMSQRRSPNAFAAALTGIYATDPAYGAKLVELMQRYDLYRFDAAARDDAHSPAASGGGAKSSAAPGGSASSPAAPGGSAKSPAAPGGSASFPAAPGAATIPGTGAANPPQHQPGGPAPAQQAPPGVGAPGSQPGPSSHPGRSSRPAYRPHPALIPGPAGAPGPWPGSNPAPVPQPKRAGGASHSGQPTLARAAGPGPATRLAAASHPARAAGPAAAQNRTANRGSAPQAGRPQRAAQGAAPGNTPAQRRAAQTADPTQRTGSARPGRAPDPAHRGAAQQRRSPGHPTGGRGPADAAGIADIPGLPEPAVTPSGQPPLPAGGTSRPRPVHTLPGARPTQTGQAPGAAHPGSVRPVPADRMPPGPAGPAAAPTGRPRPVPAPRNGAPDSTAIPGLLASAVGSPATVAPGSAVVSPGGASIPGVGPAVGGPAAPAAGSPRPGGATALGFLHGRGADAARTLSESGAAPPGSTSIPGIPPGAAAPTAHSADAAPPGGAMIPGVPRGGAGDASRASRPSTGAPQGGTTRTSPAHDGRAGHVRRATAGSGGDRIAAPTDGTGPARPSHVPGPASGSPPRPAPRPATIRGPAPATPAPTASPAPASAGAPPAPAPSAAPAPPPAPPRSKAVPRAQTSGTAPARSAAGARAASAPTAPSAPADAVPAANAAHAAPARSGPAASAPTPARARRPAAATARPGEPTVLFTTNAKANAAVTSVSVRAARYTQHLPPATGKAFLASAKVPLIRGEPLYADVAGLSGIPWQVLAACDWMQCKAKRGLSPVYGERLGTLNPDRTSYRTRSAALERCAYDLAELAHSVYQIDLTRSDPLSVRELANVFAAFRWGGLLKAHHTSAMEFPYSVAGLTMQHMHMRWPNIDDPEAPDKPGARFHKPLGAVPVVLSLNYPATV
jgi:flagellum-specific peptidoglycan hydrolase FlgJ